jgi:phosphoglycerate dehydrogenase-like enzyme
MRIVLAGMYPIGTSSSIANSLGKETTKIIPVLSQDALDEVEEADVVIVRVLKMPRKTIERIRGLRMIQRWGAGYDSVDIKAASDHGISVCNTPGANAPAVAQFTILMMLAVSRNLVGSYNALKLGIWNRDTSLKSAYTLCNKMVGIIGVGNIGRLVAKQVQIFGARTQYYDIFPMNLHQEQELGITRVTLECLLKTSDIVTLHIPLTPENYNLINDAAIASMKAGAILINTSRGGLVDERALVKAVQSGHLCGAGIDCPIEEPIWSGNPLLDEERIIVTPHIAGATQDISEYILPMIIENLQALQNGRSLPYVVNLK